MKEKKRYILCEISDLANGDLMDGRIKRLQHKCKYMGMHENDVIFGRFSKRYLENLSEAEIEQFERLLDQNDLDIFKWITGKLPVPVEFDNEVMEKLRECQEFVEHTYNPQ